MTSDPYCHACPGESEDLNHVFRSCSKVRDFWWQVYNNTQWLQLRRLPFQEWLVRNLRFKGAVGVNGPWREEFAMFLRLIWKWRNGVMFNNREVSLSENISLARNYVNEVNTIGYSE